ncbi:MAG: glycosyltransferase [Armatimonadota bacterium]
MKVLHVIHDFIPESNAGSEVFTLNLCLALRSFGVECEVFCRGYRDDVAPYEVRKDEVQGIPVTRVEVGGIGLDPVLPRSDGTIETIFEQHAARFKPDAIHFQHLLGLSSDLPRLASESGAHTLMTLHDFWLVCPTVKLLDRRGRPCERTCSVKHCRGCLWPEPDSRLERYPYRLGLPAISWGVRRMPGLMGRMVRYRNPDDITRHWLDDSNEAVSHCQVLTSPSVFLRNRVLSGGLKHSDIRVVPNGVAMSPLRELATFRKPVRFGFIGSIPLKGASVCLEAFAKLPRGAAELHLFGGLTKSERRLVRYISRSAVIVDHGAYSPDDVSSVFSIFDVLVVPSIWYENAPIVILEAFEYGRPVVCTNIGGMAEAVTDGVNGMHFQLRDSEDLASKLRRFVDEPDLIARLASGIGHTRTQDECAADFLSIYNELVAERKR